jgi:hypothetical protein
LGKVIRGVGCARKPGSPPLIAGIRRGAVGELGGFGGGAGCAPTEQLEDRAEFFEDRAESDLWNKRGAGWNLEDEAATLPSNLLED